MFGSGFTVITTVLVAAGHGPVGSLVVRVTLAVPEVMVGVKVLLREVLFPNVPWLEPHVEDVALPPIEPFNVTICPAQTD